jgi:hypothetical protein
MSTRMALPSMILIPLLQSSSSLTTDRLEVLTLAETREITKASNVFLDTEVSVDANFNYKSPRLTSLADLARDGRIRVFLTEITLLEIRANIRTAVERATAPPRPEPILRNSMLPRVRALFESIAPAEIELEFLNQLEAFIERAGVTVLPLEDKILRPVVVSYFKRLPPFGSGKNKAEFPDALAIETLREWCRAHGRSMAVITRDRGVRAACSEEGLLYHFEDLPKYLDGVASDNEARSSLIREMVQRSEHKTKIFEKARVAFPELGFFLSDQDGDVEQVVLMKIEYEGQIDIISLSLYEAIIEMPATLTFTADVSYYEPGTGYYDSEEKVLLFQELRETNVTGTAHRKVAAQIWFEDGDPESFKIQDVWFEGKHDIAVMSDYDEDWPYK